MYPVTAGPAHYYVIAYDIVDDIRRVRVAKKLQSYGDRVQFSVFWVAVSPAKFVRLKVALTELIDRSEDSVLLCDLGPASHSGLDQVSYLGCARPVTPSQGVIL